MKKTLLCTFLLAVLANTACAYTDNLNKFEIKDNNSTITINTKNTYGYSHQNLEQDKLETSKISDSYFISAFTKEEVAKLTGEDFSDKYFQELYDRLSLLKRSDLSLSTLPVPLLEIDKYLADKQINSISINELRFGKSNFDLKVAKAILGVNKVGKYQVITVSYLVKQKNTPYIIHNSFICANNMLYVLSNTYAGSLADKKHRFEDEPVTDSKVENAEISEIKPTDIPDAWNKHCDFIKAFKPLKAVKVDTKQEYGYELNHKKFTLPDNWLYQKLNLKDKELKGTILVAMPQENILKIAEDKQADTLAANILDELTANDAAVMPYKILSSKAASDYTKLMINNTDSLLVAATLQDKEFKFADLFKNPQEAQYLTALEINALLEALRQSNTNGIAIENYSYSIAINKKAANILLDSKINLFDNNKFATKVKIAAQKDNNLAFILYADKIDDKNNENLEKQLNNWEF